MQPKKILVPVDPTPASQIAWKRAMDLSERFGAAVEGAFVQQLAYVVGGLGLGPTEAGLMVQPAPDAVAELRAKLGPYAVIHTLTGLPAEELTRFAEENGFDLIVMGTHGRHGLERAVLGSVAEDVARISTVPVLVVRSETSNIRSILAPVTEESHAVHGLNAAAEAAVTFKRKLRLLHVGWEGEAEARAAVERLFEKLPRALRESSRASVETATGDPAKAIAQAADERDLIVLVSRGGGRLRERILGSTPQRVLRQAHASVLIVPAGVGPGMRRGSARVTRRARGRAAARRLP